MPVVRLFSRRPSHLPLPAPRLLDGAGWPDETVVGRPSFDSSSLHELGVRHAYDPEAHAIGSRLVDDVLERVPTGVADQDEPHLRKVYGTAARIGAGLAVVERTLPASPPGSVDRSLAGALWQARRQLPAMPADQDRTAAWFLLAGFHLGRSGPAAVRELLADLPGPADAQPGPAP